VFAAYAEACEAAGKRPIPPNEFPDAIAIGKGANETDLNGRAAKEFPELFTWLKENVK
jgi:hypothetical protein